MQIFIPGNVPSSKNNRVWTGRFFVESKRTKAYRKESQESFEFHREAFLEKLSKLEKPYKVGFHFIRNSKHKYDWVNPVQTIQDLMVEYEWIDDDNVEEMIPIPFKVKGAYSTYDKENPGVKIKLYQ